MGNFCGRNLLTEAALENRLPPDDSTQIKPQNPAPFSAMASASKAKSGENVTDLEDIVRRWASQMWDYTKNKEQSRIPKEVIQFNINWKHIKFHFDTPDYDIIPFVADANSGPKQNTQPQVLFRTTFSNQTHQEQEYSFKTERVTRSSATICIERGFTSGFDFALKLTTPCEVLEANAGFKREMSLVNIGEDTIEEELMWGVDSMVKVPPHTEASAELVITEAQCQGNFIMHTRFHGRVIVTVTNLKENNSLITIFESPIADILQREISSGTLKGFSIQGRTVVAETKGKCNFKFGIEQKVRISERPISTMEY